MKDSRMYQTHGLNVIFDGTFDDFVSEMEAAGFDVVFHPPGLVNSTGTLVVEKTPTQKALDEKGRYSESKRPNS